ncbi:MAG: rhodanese-like domain-containing protein [Mariprofundaceae bacterium]
MEWIQQNIFNILMAIIVLWVVWKRILAPKLSGVKKMTASDYLTQRDQPHTLLDVRSPSEWQSGHSPIAIHMPLGDVMTRMHELSKDKKLVVLCASGNRSAMAATKLAQAGFEDVYNFSGGMGAWQAAGLPIKKGC